MTSVNPSHGRSSSSIMGKDYDKSLGDQRTFEGSAQSDTDSQSLGDQNTLGDEISAAPDLSSLEEMEIVDLSARYQIEGTLGRGGMGEVLLAFDTRLKRKVAIKRVLDELAGSGSALNRFVTEARSIAALNHTNIVQIYDYGRDSDGPFLILEYVDGDSLLDRCREGALPLAEAVDLTCQLCDGLTKAHEAGIIHRDIKPANVLLTSDNVPKLTDFGLARDEVADTGMTKMGTVLGTLDFMPPEQRRDAALTDARSDLWSLAATLYQLVTGKSPRIINIGGLPPALQDVMVKALDENQADRYQTAIELRDALQLCQSTPETSPEHLAEVVEDECPECHTKNTPDRKFCRKCAAPLRIDCLQCEIEIPVWDNICGQCGGNQAELTSVRRNELDKQRTEAEAMCGRYQFDEALEIAATIGAIDNRRLPNHTEWVESFTASTQAEKQRQEQHATDKFSEAQTHRGACDYPSAIHAMEAIPEKMRTTEMSSYINQLQSDHNESVTLLKHISKCIKSKNLEGLAEQVKRASELRTDRDDLPKLHAQLVEREADQRARRDNGYQRARILLSHGKAREAWALIKGVGAPATDRDESLRRRLEKLAEEENNLRSLIATSKEDGVIDPDEVVQMLDATLEYLKSNPIHGQSLALRDQLLRRIYTSPDVFRDYLSRLQSNYLKSITSTQQSEIEQIKNPIKVKCPMCSASVLQDKLGSHCTKCHSATGLFTDIDYDEFVSRLAKCRAIGNDTL